jgi:hypothetical protein
VKPSIKSPNLRRRVGRLKKKRDKTRLARIQEDSIRGGEIGGKSSLTGMVVESGTTRPGESDEPFGSVSNEA